MISIMFCTIATISSELETKFLTNNRSMIVGALLEYLSQQQHLRKIAFK